MAAAASRDVQAQLASLRTAAPEPLGKADVRQVVESVLASLAGDITLNDLKVYSELEALARFIQSAKQEIAVARPAEISQQDIPLATDELDAVVGATAE